MQDAKEIFTLMSCSVKIVEAVRVGRIKPERPRPAHWCNSVPHVCKFCWKVLWNKIHQHNQDIRTRHLGPNGMKNVNVFRIIFLT